MNSDKFYFSELPNDPRLQQRDACGVGFVAQLEGKKSHQIIKDGLKILHRLDHRGGLASDGRTGDGAGIMMQIPDAFFQSYWKANNIILPDAGQYAVGMVFLPSQKDLLESLINQCNGIILENGLRVIGWRDVPVDSSVLGVLARSSEPIIKQVFIGANGSQDQFKWKLYVIRKRLEAYARELIGQSQRDFYIASLSTDTITFKGLLRSDDIDRYYLDLQSEQLTSAFAMVHQRFSTNTLPAWPLAQPFRHVCHNGEINTLRGNLNWMHARSKLLQSDRYNQKDLNDILPICPPSLSDSASLDNAVEFLLHTGRSMPKVLTMLIPQPWENREDLSDDLKAYYEYQSCVMEPWDGPAFVGFADGSHIGAVLDRNGLRPGRYTVTKDARVIMASESGVLDIAEENILEKGRLSPGRMFMIDLGEGKIISDEKIKQQLCREKPYKTWLTSNRQNLPDIVGDELYLSEHEKARYYRAFSYSREDLNLIIKPMALTGKEPIGSMGNDAPIAALSEKRPLLYNYFKQLFAQVTNPPIDAIREKMVTSLSVRLGTAENIFDENEAQCRVLLLDHPVLNSAKLKLIENGFHSSLCAQRISMVYDKKSLSLEEALDRLSATAADAVRQGKNAIVLSDKDICQGSPAIPALIAVSAVHHYLVKAGLRTKCSIIVESGEPREVHHFCTLIGYGADAIYPYLALATAACFEDSQEVAINRYIEAVKFGILKVMSKMGISTLQSYHGAQIFEALGLSSEIVDKYFCGTQTRIGGVRLKKLEEDIFLRNQLAFNKDHETDRVLEEKGDYYWRRNGEAHLHDPSMIAGLQKATRLSSREEFKDYCKKIDDQSERALTIRGRLTFKQPLSSISLDEVESVSTIMKRFSTGAMSFGSISKEAHETIAIAMNRAGARSNSGEGGEDPSRFIPDSNGDLRRSSIKQVASGRFGVTSHYLANADEIQIKMAQGAKPGEGGQLPGHKVDLEIARVRHSTPGVPLISPPPHHDIYSIEDLAQLISDLKHSNRDARISVKLVSALGVGTIASGVAKAKADSILISGCEGGTGASPLTSIKHAGMPWELGLSEAHRILSENFLRKRVRLVADGQIRTPKDIAIAAILGADEWSIGTAALVTLGCIMMRKCHLNTCPVGIATQDPELRKRFQGQPEHLVNYLVLLAEGLREIMASLGVRKVDELVGRVDLLSEDSARNSEDREMTDLDLSDILQAPRLDAFGEIALEDSQSLRDEVENGLDVRVLLEQANVAFDSEKNITICHGIQNTDRSVGTVLSFEISKRFGEQGLMPGRIKLNFTGSAGQSFMAFGARGIRASIQGDVNDYCGKGLSGGEIILKPSPKASFKASENVICGNTALYGATSGYLFVNGIAGERFAVRNSGAMAVVEGTGDHGCEYMTGGCVVVIGKVGVNFAAGMSGGISYVLDDDGSFSHSKVNHELVSLTSLALSDKEDELMVQDLLRKHLTYTNSEVACRILADWDYYRTKFIRVLPNSYREILMQKRKLCRQKVNGDNNFEEAQMTTAAEGYHHG